MVRKLVFGGGGTLLAFVGFLLLFAPGPGTLLLLAGAALIAQQSERAARLLDWFEIRVRRAGHRSFAWWQCTSTTTRSVIVMIVILLAGVVFWLGYRLYLTYFG